MARKGFVPDLFKASSAVSYAASNSDDFETATSGAVISAIVYVGTAGNAAVVTSDGDEVTFNGLQAGTILPVLLKQIKSTGTTAGGFLLLT